MNVCTRILKEIKLLKQSTDFVIDIDESNMLNFKIMFFGPADTPYHHGVFAFEVKLSSTYPIQVPEVTFLTGGIVEARMHPNLYQNGKVCVSVLNTWGVEEWSPLLTIEKVMITIRSLLDANPITNEPGFKHIKVVLKNEAWNYIQNAKYLSIKSLIDTREFFRHTEFGSHIEQYIADHQQDIQKTIHELKEFDHKFFQTLHHRHMVWNVDQIRKNIEK